MNISLPNNIPHNKHKLLHHLLSQYPHIPPPPPPPLTTTTATLPSFLLYFQQSTDCPYQLIHCFIYQNHRWITYSIISFFFSLFSLIFSIFFCFLFRLNLSSYCQHKLMSAWIEHKNKHLLNIVDVWFGKKRLRQCHDDNGIEA